MKTFEKDDDKEYALLPTDESDEEHSNDSPKLVQTTEFRDHEHATTDFETLLHIVKGTLGSGILNLPAAVRNGGVVVGPVGMLFVAIVSVHCYHLLVISSRVWCKVRGKSRMDYSDVGEECMMTRYPNKGWLGRSFINVIITLLQIGVCCIYLVFVCRNCQQIFTDNTSFNVDIKLWILMLLPLYILFSFIKNLDRLAWLSFISNLLMITGIACIFYHIFATIHDPYELPSVGPPHNLAVFFASAIFAYESISIILPLENETRNPTRFPLLMNLGMAFVTFLNISMGFFGYLSCTDECKGSITLNLGKTPFSTAVRSIMTVSMFLSYFIQAYVPFSLIEAWLFEKIVEEHHMLLISCAVRTGFVIMTAIMAITIPNLEYIIALIGAIFSTTLLVTLPPIMHSISCPSPSRFTLAKNFTISVFGVAVTILGTAVSIEKIVRLYQRPV